MSGRRRVVDRVGVALLVLLGIATVVAGGADDSPGLQGIGLLLVVAAVVIAVRTARVARGHGARSPG